MFFFISFFNVPWGGVGQDFHSLKKPSCQLLAKLHSNNKKMGMWGKVLLIRNYIRSFFGLLDIGQGTGDDLNRNVKL